MKIEEIEVYGFRAAIRGMHNPKESWAKSDTTYAYFHPEDAKWPGMRVPENPHFGPEDLNLMLGLDKGGGAHSKFLRMIDVWWDITIPSCVWAGLDTYKASTVRDSCSTMHKLASRDLEPCDFEHGDVDALVLRVQNQMGHAYRNHFQWCDSSGTYEGVALLEHMKMHLPEGFLQKATYSFNYETALKMWFDRHDHPMPQWSGPGGICETLLRLPLMKELVGAMGQARG